MQASRARLFKEYKEVQREKVADPDIQIACDDTNIFKWTALIKVTCLWVFCVIYEKSLFFYGWIGLVRA